MIGRAPQPAAEPDGGAVPPPGSLPDGHEAAPEADTVPDGVNAPLEAVTFASKWLRAALDKTSGSAGPHSLLQLSEEATSATSATPQVHAARAEAGKADGMVGSGGAGQPVAAVPRLQAADGGDGGGGDVGSGMGEAGSLFRSVLRGLLSPLLRLGGGLQVREDGSVRRRSSRSEPAFAARLSRITLG
jgi:hypothetical protein